MTKAIKEARPRMRDGVELDVTVYLPSEKDPANAILAMTPYGAQGLHDIGAGYSRHGFAFVAADVRGRGNSEGRADRRGEGRDGYDLVEWVASQPWCSGKVAMQGASYLAFCQWQTAKEAPPSLVTIAPTASPFNGVDVPMLQGFFRTYTVQWLALTRGRANHEKLFADTQYWRARYRTLFEEGAPFRRWADLCGHPSLTFDEWVDHPDRDAFWEDYNPAPHDYARMQLPILTITGAYDADQAGALEHYRLHTTYASPETAAAHHLVIGPWNHAGCSNPTKTFGGLTLGRESEIDLKGLQRGWFEWAMSDAAKPHFLYDRVIYYVIGAECWRCAPRLEQVTEFERPLRLGSTRNPTDVFASGSLTFDPVDGGREVDSYIYDPRDTSSAALEVTLDPTDLTDQTLVLAQRGKHLVYHSPPLTERLEIAGFFRLVAWLAIDQPDTDFRATIWDVDEQGGAVRMSSCQLRARYRENESVPHLVETKAPLEYEFKHFNFVARVVERGHRLRLVIGPVNSIHWQKNYNSGGIVADETMADGRPVEVRLFHSEVHASTLHVPVGSLRNPIIRAFGHD